MSVNPKALKWLAVTEKVIEGVAIIRCPFCDNADLKVKHVSENVWMSCSACKEWTSVRISGWANRSPPQSN